MKRHLFLVGLYVCYGVLSTTTSQLQAADIRFSSQNAYVSWPELATTAPSTSGASRSDTAAINNRVWTMNGSALHSSKGDSEAAFLAYSDNQIRSRLKSYLQANPTLSPTTTDLVILDMESPIHPKRFGEYSETKLVQIAEAFKRRIKIARQEFPNAKLSLYGVIVPVSSGERSDKTFQNMLKGYQRAGQLGMFDDLDYLSPVLYLRFGPKDKKYNTVEAYTRLGIEASHNLKTSRGTSLPLAPMLSFKVYNGNSSQHRQCVSPEPIQKQLRIAQEYPYVQIIVLWAGPEVITDCTLQRSLRSLATQ